MSGKEGCQPLTLGGQLVSDLGHACSTENLNEHGPSSHPDDSERWRELFPLPLCERVAHEAGLSVSARRRRAKIEILLIGPIQLSAL